MKLWLVLLASLSAGSSAVAQEVYVGVADGMEVPVQHPDQWTYVQRNASGYYVNFVTLNRVIRGVNGLSPADLQQYCQLIASHAAFLESDIRTPLPGATGTGGGGAHDGVSPEQERQYISMLHQAGCRVAYTSLNYGWSRERAANLTQFEPTPQEGRRLNFVQAAPWVVNGDVEGSSAERRAGYNERTRRSILQSDGVSTDGPLGFWGSDSGKIKEGSISLVRYAHAHHRKAMVMLSPYGAGQAGYDAKTDFLPQAKQAVHDLEAAQAVPDIYVVFEYATAIASVPESRDGQPANTTMGVAYWLLHHLRDRQAFP